MEKNLIMSKGSPKVKGEAAQLAILARLALRGHTVLLPYGDALRYDLALDQDGRLARIQCKLGRLKDGAIVFRLYSVHGRSSTERRQYTGDIEFFGVYCPETDKCYLVPMEDIKGMKYNCALRVDKPRNAQVKNIRWAKTYEL